MIVTELILQGVFDQIPGIAINDNVTRKPKFAYGDRSELVKYVVAKGDETYPLIWLLMSSVQPHEKHIENGTLCQRTCELVLATRESDKSLLPNERFEKSFKYTLNPLLDYVSQAISSSNEMRLLQDVFETGRYFDIVVSESAEESYSIDLWDAIKVKCDIEFIKVNDNCKNTIKWRTPKIT